MLMWNPVKTARVDSSFKVTFSAVPSGRPELNDNQDFRPCMALLFCNVSCFHTATPEFMYLLWTVRQSDVQRKRRTTLLVSFAKASALHGRCFSY